MRLVNGFLRIVPVLGICAAALLCPLTAKAAILVIDNFSDGGGNLTANANLNEGPALTGTLGGNRDTTITKLLGGGSTTASINSDTPGAINMNDTVGVTGELVVFWLANNADLTIGGATGVNIDFLVTDAAATIKLKLEDIDGGASQEVVLPSPASGFLFFPYSSFGTLSPANLQSIDKVTLTVTGSPSGDYSISLVQTQDAPSSVPEPSTWVLGLVGLAGLGLVAYRRRRA